MDHIMISLDVTSLFKNFPIDMVKNSIEKRWNLIKSATNLPLQEFQKGLEFLMEILFFSLRINIIKFLVLQLDLLFPMLADLVLQDL